MKLIIFSALFRMGLFSMIGVVLLFIGIRVGEDRAAMHYREQNLRAQLVDDTFTFPTGYDIWHEVNAYRKELGIPALVMDERLCNNIGERAVHYRLHNSHEGIAEFRKRWMPEIDSLSEVLNFGYTAKEVVDGWKGSPSHNIMITKRTKGCAYSDNGYSVMLLSN